MKRFLCFIAAIATMLIYFAAPLFAHADNQIFEDISTLEFYSFEDFENVFSSFKTGRSLEFQAMWKDTGSNGVYFYTFGFNMNESNYTNVSITNNDNLITINFGSPQTYYEAYHYYAFDNLNFDSLHAIGMQHYHSLHCNDGSRSVSSRPSILSITLDTTTNVLNLYSSNGTLYKSYIYHDMRTNFDNIGSDQYDIDVSFTPDLSGNVDRKINGNVSEELSITVENHSRFDVQVLMTIVPRGGSLNFYDRSDDSQDKQISSVYAADSEFSFVWWSDEWNYNFDSMIQTSSPHAHHANFSEVYTCSKQYGACPWHFVASGRSVTHKFNWSQIDLVEFGQYDVLVYALRCDSGIVSRQAAYDDADYFVDYSNIQLVYSSSFTLTNGYKFDLNDYSNGNYPVHSSAESINLGWSSKGYVDKDTGVTVIKDKKLSDYLDKQHEIQNQWDLEYSQNVYTGSSGSVSPSLKSHFNSFLGFVNYIFNRLPGDVHSIYIYGFVCIVVLGIIFKVVRS